MMMGWSDNEATNVLIDRVGMDAVNRRLGRAGLAQTRLRRKMMDLEAARRGDENVGTPSEMRRLVETIYAGNGPLARALAADIRDRGRGDQGLAVPRPRCRRRSSMLDKPGALEGVRCVSGGGGRCRAGPTRSAS